GGPAGRAVLRAERVAVGPLGGQAVAAAARESGRRQRLARVLAPPATDADVLAVREPRRPLRQGVADRHVCRRADQPRRPEPVPGLAGHGGGAAVLAGAAPPAPACAVSASRPPPPPRACPRP